MRSWMRFHSRFMFIGVGPALSPKLAGTYFVLTDIRNLCRDQDVVDGNSCGNLGIIQGRLSNIYYKLGFIRSKDCPLFLSLK